ncbi:MAG: hypothetical protein SVK08_00905 [Halobacteriota archaeon]|nr:hypothetical protein [Halobacteriota archaeon]
MPLLEKKLPPESTGIFPHEDYEAETEKFREEYDRLHGATIDPTDLLPPTSDNYLNTATDVTNILFGDEMSSVGIELDKEGFHWDLETAKDFWSEHPVRATLATLTTFVPMAKIATKSMRHAKLAGVTDNMILDMNMVDSVDDLVRMGDREKDILKQQYLSYTQNRDLAERIELGTASVKDRAAYKMYKMFGNSYMEQTDPKLMSSVRAEWQQNINGLLAENGAITDFLKTMPDDDGIGINIARYLENPAELGNIPKKYQSWAIRLGDELRDTQKTMVAEGLIANEEASKVGDVWFSMVREGYSRDMGNITTIIERTASGKPRVLTVPKTTSPNLLQRKMGKGEVESFLIKQQAAEMIATGRTSEAADLLKRSGDAFDDARNLIKEGKKDAAIRLLRVDGKVDFSPKSLTFNTLFSQKQLLENYRILRDIALNPDITRTRAEIAKLGPTAQKNWMHLGQLDGADRLQRMVEIKNGEAIDGLGYVPKRLFAEMKEIIGQGENANWKSGAGDFTQAIVAMYKTAKTAFNVPTHLQNTIGNDFFLLNAGVNPLSKDFMKLKGIALGAINSMQRATRRGVGIEAELSKVLKKSKLQTKIPSHIETKHIDVLEELQSSELSDLLELSSMLQAEGIGVLQNIVKNAEHSPVKAMVNGYNKVLRATKAERAADLYMAEDGMAKMAYFLHLRQKGFSRSAALNEVGRRLPMYNTVGQLPALARSSVLPWVTFPVEAMRILRNNLTDHPLKTMMLLQMPELMQVGAYGAGRAGVAGAVQMNAEEIQQRKGMLPNWAQRPSAFMTPWTDKNGDFRAAMMDWLPYSATMPPTVAKEAPLMKKLPFGADEPLPIYGALYYALTGKDAWGREMPTAGVTGKISNVLLNTMGLIMPPLAQKYLFNPTQPKAGYALLQDLGKAVNPYTNKEGDPVLDIFMNRVVGVKTYAASPEQQLANETFTKRNLQSLRARYTREWSALLKSNDIQGASEKLRDIHTSFVTEWGDPQMAQSKFSAWLSRHWTDLAKHPQLRGLSKEELEYRIKQTKNAGETRTRAQRELLATYQAELGRRGRQSKGGSINPLIVSLAKTASSQGRNPRLNISMAQ